MRDGDLGCSETWAVLYVDGFRSADFSECEKRVELRATTYSRRPKSRNLCIPNLQPLILNPKLRVSGKLNLNPKKQKVAT